MLRKLIACERIFQKSCHMSAKLCYPLHVQQKFTNRAFPFYVSTHEFVRLLSYTASYF
jgi:hypothetical protein